MNTTTIILITCGTIIVLLILFTLFLFFRGSGQKLPQYEQRRFGYLTACLLRLSGHHPAEFYRLHESVAWRFAAVGLSVMVPPLIAFAGIWATCEVFEKGGALAKALGGGLFVMMLDFILVAALSGGRNSRASWVLVVYRSAVAIGLGWFIARAPILMIYQSSIDGLSREDRREEQSKIMERREALRKDSMAAQMPLAEHYSSRQKVLQEALKNVIASKGPVNERIIELDMNRQKEDLDGLDGTKPGRGSKYEKRLGYLNDEKEKLEKIEREETRIQAELATLASAHEEQLRKLNDDPAFKKYGETTSAQIGESQASRPGWSEREDLLMKWVMTDPTKRLPGLIAIHIVLLLLDVLPLLTMLFVPKEELVTGRRTRNAVSKAEAEWTEKLASEGAENLVRERYTHDLLLERIPIFKETADLRWDITHHQILREAQEAAAIRPVWFKLRFGTTDSTPERDAEWVRASELLQRVREKNLRDFDILIG